MSAGPAKQAPAAVLPAGASSCTNNELSSAQPRNQYSAIIPHSSQLLWSEGASAARTQYPGADRVRPDRGD